MITTVPANPIHRTRLFQSDIICSLLLSLCEMASSYAALTAATILSFSGSRSQVALICPTGAPSKILSSGPAKNISLHELVETALWIPTSRLTRRGVSRSSRTRGGMRWTRQRFARDGIAGRIERSVSDHRHADERCCSVRQNRVVLTPRCWRQVLRSCVGPTGLRQNISADDGGKRARSPGSAT
jgi:hypothetical protein